MVTKLDNIIPRAFICYISNKILWRRDGMGSGDSGMDGRDMVKKWELEGLGDDNLKCYLSILFFLLPLRKSFSLF